MREQQREIFKDAFEWRIRNLRPGSIQRIEYPECGKYHKPSRVGGK